MSEAASYSVRDGVAVITLNNPPVNGLGLPTRRELAAAMDRGEVDGQTRTSPGCSLYSSGGRGSCTAAARSRA